VLSPVYTIQPVVKPVVKPVSQPVVSCIQTFNRLSNPSDNRFDNRLNVCLHDTAGVNRFDNWLYRVNGVLQLNKRVFVLFFVSKCRKKLVNFWRTLLPNLYHNFLHFPYSLLYNVQTSKVTKTRKYCVGVKLDI